MATRIFLIVLSICVCRTIGFRVGNAKIQVERSKFAIYALGDSHGDFGFFVEEMLSTGKFVIDPPNPNGTLKWNPELSDNNFQVVLLGDYIDRGTRSKAMLCTLLRLKRDERFGDNLVPLMGNHESMLLRFKYSQAGTIPGNDLPADLRVGMFISEAYSLDESCHFEDERGRWSRDLYSWMTTLPIIHLAEHPDGGALFMHAGLSLPVVEKTIAAGRVALGSDSLKTPSELIDYINSGARKYYGAVKDAVDEAQQEKNFENERQMEKNLLERMAEAARNVERPVFLASDGSGYSVDAGVLWFRGYTSMRGEETATRGSKTRMIRNKAKFDKYGNPELGAGENASCEMNTLVRSYFGASVMVMAHTTHEWVTSFCSNSVFAVDTSPKSCQQGKDSDGECDITQTVFRQTSYDRLTVREATASTLRLPTTAGGAVDPDRAEVCHFEAVEGAGGVNTFMRGCHQRFATRDTYLSQGELDEGHFSRKDANY